MDNRDDLAARLDHPVVAFGHGRGDPAAADAIVQHLAAAAPASLAAGEAGPG